MCTQGPLDSFWQLFSFPRFRSNSASSDRKRLLVNAALGQCPLPGIICYYDMNRHVWRSLHVNVLGGGGWNTEQGEESRATRSAAVVGWLLHGPGEFSGADFLDQVDGEKMKKGSEGQHTASPLPAPSSASPSVPSIFLRFLL